MTRKTATKKRAAKKRAPAGETRLVGAAELSRHLAVSTRYLRDLVAAGVVRKAAGNKYDLEENCSAYVRHLRDAKEGDGSPEFKAEQARLYRARADMAELESARKAGELVPAAQVEAAVGDLIVTARNYLAAVPSKAAARFPNPGAALPIIEEACRDALEALADREVERVVSESSGS